MAVMVEPATSVNAPPDDVAACSLAVMLPAPAPTKTIAIARRNFDMSMPLPLLTFVFCARFCGLIVAATDNPCESCSSAKGMGSSGWKAGAGSSG